MSHNMANFGPLAAEICSGVWDTPANFNGFRIGGVMHGTLVVGVSQTAALNRGRHAPIFGRAAITLAHILVRFKLDMSSRFRSTSQNISKRKQSYLKFEISKFRFTN